MSAYSPELVAQFQQKVQSYLPTALQHLEDLVRIPGVSAEGLESAALQSSAEAVAELAKSMGMQADIRRAPTGDGHTGAPAVVIQNTNFDPNLPSLLLYAHHDVQPAGCLEDWQSPPFEPQVRSGRMYGRGTTDDKAGIILHLAALQILGEQFKNKVTLFIEGEEESGSPSFRQFLSENADDLAADIIIVADSAHIDTQTPALTTTLRGNTRLRIDVKVAENGLHSGVFGGPILDAPTVLMRLLSQLHDSEGQVQVPGLNKASDPSYTYDPQQFRAEAQTVDGLTLVGEDSLSAQLWTRPAINIVGFDITPIAQASNTIIPQASAMISVRIAPDQNPQEAATAVTDYLFALPRGGAQLSVQAVDTGSGFQANTGSHEATAYLQALSASWQQPATEMGMGGSIPFVADFAEFFPEAQILVTGIGEPKSAIHGPNESLDLQVFERSLLAHILFLQGLNG